MTEPTAPSIDLAGLRGLLAKATQGEWSSGGVFMPHSAAPETSIWGPTPPGMQSGAWIVKGASLNDAALIVAAVNALPSLLSAAEREQQLVAALENAQRDLGHILAGLPVRSVRNLRPLVQAALERARTALANAESSDEGCAHV